MIVNHCFDDLFVFADVLGFAETQKQTFGTDVEFSHFKEFYSLIREQLSSLNEVGSGYIHGKPKWEMKVFTDNIVLGFPLLTHDAELEIATIVLSLAPYQLALARRGFFVRGGITLGPLFMDEFVVYGPALLEAHEIEHNLARDPRIVVSKEVCELLKQHIYYRLDPEDAPQNKEFLVDTDGQIFVNYLGRCFRSSDNGGLDSDSLRMHKKHIEIGLHDHTSNPRIWAKYSWLATYHNYAVRDLDLNLSLTIDTKLHHDGPVRICPFLVSSWEMRCKQAEQQDDPRIS